MKFEYHEPGSLAGATTLLEQYGSDAALLAGGTALLVDMRHGEQRPAHLISLWGIPNLNRVQANGGLHVGALTTITDLAEFVAGYPALHGLQEAARLLGSRQIQNVATVGGNICKASPGADMVPPLLCVDAQLYLVGPDVERLVPLDGFLIGPDRTAIQTNEVMTEIYIPPSKPKTGSAFLKVMRRGAVDCAIVSVAATLRLAQDGQRCEQARIAIGAAAPTPFRSKRAEAILAGSELEPPVIREAARLAREDSRPITDVRASAGYRRALVETLVERAILKAWQCATQAGEQP